MAEMGRIISYVKLEEMITSCFSRLGLSSSASSDAARSFLVAEACGVQTHGIGMLKAHFQRLSKGEYELEPTFPVITEGTAFAVIDGENSMGAVSAAHCMRIAIDGCRTTGVYTVLSRHNNTYGAGLAYPLMAAEDGLIGIVMCNSPAAMAPWNGQERLLGTNPISIAIPCGENDAIVVDMATSVVSKSALGKALRENRPIPEGWASDQFGKPTMDPLEGIKGFMLPMAGHKGYGLAMAIDLLSGLLSGAAFLDGVGKFYSEKPSCMDVGFFLMAIDPVQVFGDGFYDSAKEYAEHIRSSRPIDDDVLVRTPGERAIEELKRAKAGGLFVNEEILCLLEMVQRGAVSDK